MDDAPEGPPRRSFEPPPPGRKPGVSTGGTLLIIGAGLVLALLALGFIGSRIGSSTTATPSTAPSTVTTSTVPTTTPATTTTAPPVGPIPTSALDLLKNVQIKWATEPVTDDKAEDDSVLSQAHASYLTTGSAQIAVTVYVVDPAKAHDFGQQLARMDGDGFLSGRCAGDKVMWQQVKVKDGAVDDAGPSELAHQATIGRGVGC